MTTIDAQPCARLNIANSRAYTVAQLGAAEKRLMDCLPDNYLVRLVRSEGDLVTLVVEDPTADAFDRYDLLVMLQMMTMGR